MHLKVNSRGIQEWAFSWTSPLSPRTPGGTPAGEATQGEWLKV